MVIVNSSFNRGYNHASFQYFYTILSYGFERSTKGPKKIEGKRPDGPPVVLPIQLVDAQYYLPVFLMVSKYLPITPEPFFVPVTEPYEHSEPLHQVGHDLEFVPRHGGQSQPR